MTVAVFEEKPPLLVSRELSGRAFFTLSPGIVLGLSFVQRVGPAGIDFADCDLLRRGGWAVVSFDWMVGLGRRWPPRR